LNRGSRVIRGTNNITEFQFPFSLTTLSSLIANFSLACFACFVIATHGSESCFLYSVERTRDPKRPFRPSQVSSKGASQGQTPLRPTRALKMSAKNVGSTNGNGNGNGNGRKPASAATNLIGMFNCHLTRRYKDKHMLIVFPLTAGGAAGMMEALVCHPLGKFLFSFASFSVN
jgi:hypothetical protein